MRIAILGSGYAGMFAALRLAEKNISDIEEITIFEKESYPGGLIATHSEQGYNWDKGVFIFPSINPISQRFPELLDRLEHFSQETFMKGRIYDLQQLMKDSVNSLSLIGKSLFLLDFGYSYLRSIVGLTEKNLFDWIRYRVTRKLYPETQLETYLRKLQGMPTKELSARIGWERIDFIHYITRPSTILRNLLKIKKRPKGEPIYSLYPFKHPVSKLGEEAAKLCESKGIKIHLNAEVSAISKSENGTYTIKCFNSDTASSYEYTHLISTIPLTRTVQIAEFPISEKTKKEAQSLKFMNLTLVHFALKGALRENEYIVRYSFEPYHRWKRIAALPFDDKSHCLTVEVTHMPGKLTVDDKLLDEIENQLVDDLKFFSKDQIILRTCSEVPNAYPIYENGFDKKVESIRHELDSDTFKVAGRQGQFSYVNSINAISQGEVAAEHILKNIRKKE